MRTRLIRLSVLIASLWLVPALCAQATVELIVERTGYQGETLSAVIRVNNFQECGTPALPEIVDCAVGPLRSTGESSTTTIINGRRSMRVTRTWRVLLTPTKAGVLTIPPILVEADGKTLRTKPAFVRILKSDADELFSAELTCKQTPLYVGQTAPVTLTIWVRAVNAPRSSRSRKSNPLPVQTVWNLIDKRGLGPFTGQVPLVKQRGSGDDLHYGFITAANITPKRSGPLVIDNLNVTMQYPIQFGFDFFDRLTVRQSRNLRAAPTSDIDVLPLPSEGRPANFGGAVGRYDISVRADTTSVRVGDPIQLTIDVTGDGPIAALGPPQLSSDIKMNDGFRVPRERLAGEIVGRAKRFTQLIRAKRADVSEIPPIEYPYFDPRLGKYAVARSRAIPISVAAVESLDASDLTGIATPQRNEGRRLATLDGLRGNETSEALLLADYRPTAAWHVAAATFAPAALFVMAWAPTVYRRNRQADAAGRRRQAALSHARRRIEKARSIEPADSAREILAAMSGYLADRLDQPAGRYHGAVSTEFLRKRGVDAELIDDWSDIIDQCEQASFGGNVNGDAAALADRARDCLGRIERLRL